MTDKILLPLAGKTVLVVLRHAHSLQVVQDYVTALGGASRAVALDPIAAANQVKTALADILAAIPYTDIVITGTKVYDEVKDGPSRLADLLDLFQTAGIGAKPVCLTHLQNFTPEALAALRASPLKLLWCENDNLKRDGMTQLGPLILQAAALPV